MGYLAAKTERVEIGSAILPIYSRTPTLIAMTAAGVDAVSGGRCHPRPRRVGTPGDRGLPRRAVRPPARPHPRDHRDLPRRVGPRGAADPRRRASYHIPLPAGEGTGLGKPLKLINHPVRSRIPIWVAALGEKNVAMTAEVADGWLPDLLRAREGQGGLRPLAGAPGRPSGTRRSDTLQIAAGGLLAIGEESEVAPIRDLGRGGAALYIGGMGAKGKNFYNALACRYGYEKEATEIQDLYLSGKKKEAAALVPAELLEATSLCGPESYIKERVAALAEVGRDPPQRDAGRRRSGRHDRKAAKLGARAPEEEHHARPDHPRRHASPTVRGGRPGPVTSPSTAASSPRWARSRAGPARDRRRRPPRHAGLGRHPHPLRRPGHLGPARCSPSGWHGVTTVVMGNCGVGFAPARESDRAWLIQLMEGVEDIPGTALAEGMNWNWETFGEYLDEVERTARVLDVASPRARTARCAPTCSARAGPTTRPTATRSRRWPRIVREAVPGRRHRRLDDADDPAPGQGRRAGGGHHGGGRRADRHRRGAGQGGAPGLLGGQRHVGSRPRVRLDVGDLHRGPACR